MVALDYTDKGRRPSTRQILADWKKQGKPAEFTVEYGETYAHFLLYLGRWTSDGNGCEGVKRDQVAAELNYDESLGSK